MTISADIERPKAYSYVRFSTPEQERGDSFRRQTALATEWALRNGVDLDDSSYQDLGVSAYSGDNAETGMLGEFREAVRIGVVEQGSYLLIEGLDRLSRDKPRKAVRLLEDICESGIHVVTLADGKVYSTDALDNDPMAFMWAFMVAIRANEESATKSRRVREAWGRKKEAAATDKKPMTKRLPAWLTLSEDRTTIGTIPERVDVIRRIFREALKGTGQHRIAWMLNQEGVSPFGDGERRAVAGPHQVVQFEC
jgi:DNA invertase Pin-like site-specific DNA recombinase